jgi:hypothetical protein
VNSVVKASVVFHSFMGSWKGLWCEVGENFAVNPQTFAIPSEEDEGQQRLSKAQLLINRLADYFLTLTGAVPREWRLR